jgi:hypothetical protein
VTIRYAPESRGRTERPKRQGYPERLRIYATCLKVVAIISCRLSRCGRSIPSDTSARCPALLGVPAWDLGTLNPGL